MCQHCKDEEYKCVWCKKKPSEQKTTGYYLVTSASMGYKAVRCNNPDCKNKMEERKKDFSSIQDWKESWIEIQEIGEK